MANQVDWAIPSLLPDENDTATRYLFLDEITSAPPTVSAAAYQLILDRRLGDYVVPEGWVIFAAGNRQGDRGVTYSNCQHLWQTVFHIMSSMSFG
ncbi:conserved hypothetical protein [uncultured Gammaproteobacteria bacterium]|nr:conserved hypothetical protein [uncultured Gammaproteobacteria bacterium]